MNYLLVGLNYALMILIPVGVALWIHRKTGAAGRFFFMGAVTFVVSQVFHIPFNWLVQRSGVLPADLGPWANLLVVALFLGLSAGFFEETARYLTYRYWAKDARSWSRGLMLGAGHGGSESILLGALAAVNLVALVALSHNPALLGGIPEEQRALIGQTLSTIAATPWYGLMLGAFERVLALSAHLAMSLLVLQVFRRGAIRWLLLSIGYHAVFDMLAVISAARLGAYAAEGMLAVFSLLSLFIIFRLRTPEPVEVEPEPLPAPPEFRPPELEATPEMLDRSRFS